MGGAVAFEMARRLEAEGEQVEFVALFDSNPPSKGKTHSELTDANVLLQFAEETELDISLEQLTELPPEEQLPFVVEEAKKRNVLSEEISLSQAGRMLDVFKHNVHAVREYDGPRLYGGQLTLFTSSERLKDPRRDPTRGWRHWSTQEVMVQAASGTHHTMLGKPHVRSLAEQMKPFLHRNNGKSHS